MRGLALLLALFFSVSYARVTFHYSEVLQAPDIAGTNKAGLNCKNGCKLYVDRKADQLVVTQNGKIIKTFDDIYEINDECIPGGLELPPADDYLLENLAKDNSNFVFYVVDSTAPNYNSPVVAPSKTLGVSYQRTARYVTVLSSNEAIQFSSFTGTFPEGYPRIYGTGFDAAGDACHPVYTARSQHNAETSWPTIGSAVITVDFGYVGDHNVSINFRKFSDPMKSGAVSTVYTSPGYVGCSFNAGQNYYSPIYKLQEAFVLMTEGLDIEGVSNALAADETLYLNVNEDHLDMVGTTTLNKHYGKGSVPVAISWVRRTPSSSFALQLDFGNGKDQSPTAPPLPPTTTSCSSLSNLLAIALVVAACLT